jgi:cytochrome c oxidase subunit 2
MKGPIVILTGLLVLAAFLLPLPASQGEVRQFEITAKRFEFSPATIEVTQGDTVRLTVKSADSVHGIEIEKFKVNEEIPKGGTPVVVEFVASEAGTFEIVCSEYCGSGHKQMKGTLVVAPKSRH